MRLSEYTDYTLRVLMYCAARPGQLVTIGEVAAHHGLSKNHLMKVVNDLARQGLLETTRGRGGGLRLLKDPRDIRVGDVVRASETDFRLVECFDARTNLCTLTPTCHLKHLFGDALQAYFAALDSATLADVTAPVRTEPIVAHRGEVVAMPQRPARPARAVRVLRTHTKPARRLKATP